MSDNPPLVLFRTASRVCGLPVVSVVETLRPLPIRAMAGAPDFVLGVSIIRGQVVPVLDVEAMLTGERGSSCARFVCVRVGERRVALAVAAVLGVRVMDPKTLLATPPLLQEANWGVVEAMRRVDAELCVVLRAGRLLPETLWPLLPMQPAQATWVIEPNLAVPGPPAVATTAGQR